jgi:hypothetical protein
MQPGQIRVFDGLRITTEHIEHFQESLQSALREVRGAVGIGRVRGLEVARGDGDVVTVAPGVGFSPPGGRIVCDEAMSAPVAFEPDADRLYVAVRYAQVEAGVVEDHPTLIWDTGAVVLVPALPGPDEDVVVLAKVVRRPEGGFDVVRLPEPEPAPPSMPAAGAGESRPRLRVRQDVVEITGEPEGRKLREILANSSGAASSGGPVRIALRSVEMPLDFAPSSLGLDSIVTVRIGGAETSAGFVCEATARGEATAVEAAFAQSALTTVTGPGGTASSIARGACALVAPHDVRGGESDALAQLVAPLRVRLEVTPGASSGFVIGCWLEWQGGVSEADSKRLEAAGAVLRWSASLAWKALGESA